MYIRYPDRASDDDFPEIKWGTYPFVVSDLIRAVKEFFSMGLETK
jgi:hypothetical protein